MARSLTRGVPLLAAALLASGAAAGETVRFELCGRELASVEVGRFEGAQEWAVLVQLAPTDAEAFRSATASHPGVLLEITHGGRVFVSGRISGEIRSGVITATYREQEDAERSRIALLEKSAVVCEGVASQD